MKNPASLKFEDHNTERRFLDRYADKNFDFYLLSGIAVAVLQIAVLVRNYIEPLALAGAIDVLVLGVTLPATLVAVALLWSRRLSIPVVVHAYALFVGLIFLVYPFLVDPSYVHVLGFKNLAAFMCASHILRLRARIMVPFNLLIAVVYPMLALSIAEMRSAALVVHEATMLAGIVVGLMVAYLIELNARRHFDEINRLASTHEEAEKGRVFVSHSGNDRELVASSIVQFLQQAGYSAWYSTSDIRAASDWQNSILAALEDSEWFLLVMSESSANSEWVKDELFWAIDHRPDKIIPVKIDDCDDNAFHIRLRRIQAIDFRDRETGQRAIHEALRGE